MKTCALLPCLLAILLHGNAGACGSYQVAHYDHGALSARQADGQWRGIDHDVVAELARRTGCKLEPRLESRVRIWTMMESGLLDMTTSGVSTPEREGFAYFIPYIKTRNYLLLNKDVDPRVQSLDDFAADPRYKVAAVKSFRHGPTLDAWLARLRAQGRVYDVVDVTALIRLAKIGRVHAVIALQTSWVPIHADTAAAGMRVVDWAHDPLVGNLVLSKKRMPQATAVLFAQAIAAMRQDGTLEAIFARHMGADLAPAMLRY